MKILDSVWVGPMTVHGLLILRAADIAERDLGIEMWWTCCGEGKHSTKSKHYHGDALDFDIVPWRSDTALSVKAKIEENLPTGYDVLIEEYERDGLPNGHLHIEFDPRIEWVKVKIDRR